MKEKEILLRRERLKRLFLKIIKEDKKFHIDFYKEYQNDYVTRVLWDALFKSLCPYEILRNMYQKTILAQSHRLYKKLYENIGGSDRGNFMFFVDKPFVAKKNKQKIELHKFCNKYGILPCNIKIPLDTYINSYHTFYINYDFFLVKNNEVNTNRSVTNYIYHFENLYNKLNGINLSFWEEIRRKIKSCF